MKLGLRTLPLLTQLESLFFVSGFSALLLEVVSVRLLRYWAGNTAFAVGAVLCAYMAGLAMGSQMAGKWLVSRASLLIVYGVLEFVVGIYALGLPTLMKLLEPAYVALSLKVGPDSSFAIFVHFLAAATLLLCPTLMMGATFPVVVRAASQGSGDQPNLAEKLYSANLAGAALGAISSDFLCIRLWGLGNTLAFVAIANSAVAMTAYILARDRACGRVEPESSEPRQGPAGRRQVAPLWVALASGFLILSQEIVWTNLMGRFLDDTVYGFAVALFVVIVGLGLGATLVARNPFKRPAVTLLPWTCLGAGFLALALGPLWDNARYFARGYSFLAVYAFLALVGVFVIVLAPVPRTLAFVFAAFPVTYAFIILLEKVSPIAAAFWSHHLVMLSISGLFTLATAVLMGMGFPLALDWYLEPGGDTTPSVAPIYAVNTLGSLAGIVVATFLLLPRTGVEWGGRTIGLGFVLLGVVLMWRLAGKRRLWVLGSLPVAVWLLLVGPWDYSEDHFALGHRGTLIYAGEDLNGGLTTVLDDGGDRHLYSNGFLQGGIGEVVGDQVRVAMVPMLYVHEFNRAMVIGVGSGQTAGVVQLFPFQRIDLVDLSPRVVEAAQTLFSDLNRNVLGNPRVRVHIADGRHYLLTHPERFSLITLEASRLWFAGEGDLYTREFYQLCSARLAQDGVLQQWVPLFDLSVQDTVILLRTVRTEFLYVAFYMGTESGMIVASRSPLRIDYRRLLEIDDRPERRRALINIGLPRSYFLLGDCVLTPEGVDRFLAQEPERRVSTDFWPHLEYSNAHFYMGNRSSKPLRLHLLGAQQFPMPEIENADSATMGEILKDAAAERQRLFRVFPPH